MDAVMKENKKKSKYFAFISYSHSDKSWAVKTQESLEKYRLPVRLRKKYANFPHRAFPICRDDTNVSGFKTWASITKELDDSQHLIVICSPQSAASPWVNDEIQYFIEQGKEDKILPLIVEGVPHSGDPETECFPQALLDMAEDPLGVDVQALGWRKAYLRMVSTLLRIDYDELLMRDTWRRVRNGIAGAVAGALCIAVSIGLLLYNTERSRYYNTYVLRNEIPVGIYELSKEERAVRSESYRLTTLRGRVIRLECVNSLGTVIVPDVTTTLTDYPILEYQYDNAGALITVVQKDATGMEVSQKILSANPQTNEIAIDFRAPSNSLNAQALSADMSAWLVGDTTISEKSEITRQRNSYDEEGRLVRSLYQRDNLGTPACDSNGIYGKTYEYNDRGLVSRISNLNARGEVYNCKYGWAYEDFLYDDRGNENRSQFFDAAGNPVCGKDGYSAACMEYDAAGNAVCWSLLDETGAPAYHRDGYSVVRMEYDRQGLRISQKYFDAEENPIYSSEGLHEGRFEYDEYGRRSVVSCYGTDGSPVYSPALSFAIRRLAFDRDGRLLEEWYYDVQGEPTCDRTLGVYGVRHTYDENGFLIQTEYLDTRGNLCLSKRGYAAFRNFRDGDGRFLREEYLDTKGSLTCNTSNFAVVEVSYDVFGNMNEARFYDETEAPCYHAEGYSIVQWEYEEGNLISEKFLDAEGKPMFCKDFYHECRMDYENGNCIRWSYYDTEGALIELEDGHAITEQEYDEYGNVTEKRTYNALGQPMQSTKSHTTIWKYDSRGNLVREEAMTAFPESLDYVVAEMEYDAYGNVIRQYFYDENGDPPAAHRMQENLEYDLRGNLVRKEEIMSWEPDRTGVNEYAYDDFGNKISYHGFWESRTGDRETVQRIRYSYDEFGNCIREDFLDGQGDPALQEEGYASHVCGYTPTGYVQWEEYYDENGEPCLYADTAFRYEYQYDAVGNKLEERRYDTDGNLLREKDGKTAVRRYEYDSRGFNISQELYNERNELTASAEYFMDVMGYQESSVYYDADGTQLGKKHVFVYLAEVLEGGSAMEAGIQSGTFVVQLGDWNYFEEGQLSISHAMQKELSRTMYKEKDLVLCSMTENETLEFTRYHLPEGSMGIRLTSDEGNVVSIATIREAYFRWLERNP